MDGSSNVHAEVITDKEGGSEETLLLMSFLFVLIVLQYDSIVMDVYVMSEEFCHLSFSFFKF